jgi:alpha-beta hydrolase superfamily lysophospholipase
MSASHKEAPADPANGTGRPLYFRSAGNDLFGWLHETPRPAPVGVVVCAPFGYEAICAHRSLRAFAEEIARSGIPTLRFDYAGTGDSSDPEGTVDQVALWTQDILAAAQELKARTGVERVCLLGIRLGALLAARASIEAAAQGAPGLIESLICVGPVLSGRRYLRELRLTQRFGDGLSGSAEEGQGAARGGQNQLEAGGFCLPAATVEALGRLDLGSQPPPVRSMLILDNDKLPVAKRWSESLSGAGMAIRYLTMPGLVEMAMTPPHFAQVPHPMIEASCEWLAADAVAGAATAVPHDTGECAKEALALPDAILLATEYPDPSAAIRERAVFLPTDVPLFGIVTEPPACEKRRRCVILLNPAADYHIGASRMYVSLARRWATRGYYVLRMDLGGVGDSATRPGKIDDEVFPDEAIEDVRSAIDFMRARFGAADITVAGLCSGAYHALRAAAARLPIHRILMVNPLNFFWNKGQTLEQIQLADVAHNPGVYRRQALSLHAWRRLLTGDVDLTRIAGIYLQRLRLFGENSLRQGLRRLRIHLPNDLGWELEQIAQRGVRISFMFARGEAGIDLLEMQSGSTLDRLAATYRVRIVESGDHIFSRLEPRLLMEEALSDELFARPQRSGEAVSGAGRRAIGAAA